GSGVLTGDTTRIRDQFLDLRSYQEHAVDAGLTQSQSVLSRVELAFDEPSDDGLSKLISGFLAGFDDVANNPDDLAARAQLAEQVGVTVSDGEHGQIDVFVGGTALVRGTKAAALKVDVGTDPAQTVRVTWADDNYPAGVSGTAGGMLSGVNDVIPRYRAGL